VADWQLAHPQPRGVILSLNVPVRPYEALLGIRPATMAPVFLDTPAYTEGEDGEGPWYLYRDGEGLPLDDPGCDVALTDRGYCSLTKLTWDFRLNADDAELGEIRL